MVCSLIVQITVMGTDFFNDLYQPRPAGELFFNVTFLWVGGAARGRGTDPWLGNMGHHNPVYVGYIVASKNMDSLISR